MQIKTDAVCFGEVLWDVLPSGARPGGAPMNVAYHLTKMGVQTTLVSRVGTDKKGDELRTILEQAGLNTLFVQTDSENPTGLVNATLHESNEVSYEIVHPVAWDFIQLHPDMTSLVSKADFFVYGSLAARDQTTAQTLWKLVDVAKTRVVDINLRPPHFTQDTVERLIRSATILKLNEHELPLIAAWYGDAATAEEQVQFLSTHFGTETIIVTRGGSGAMVCHEGRLHTHPGYPVTVADTIGSGDAFLAGFLAKTKKGAGMEERLRFANALGAFIASKEGACPAYQPADIDALLTRQA